jgi:ferric enterobactin receptor
VKYIVSLVLLFLVFTANAQFPMGGGAKGPTIKGKIEGKIIDSLSNEPVGFATISLKKKGSSIIIDGVLSEENGNFIFEKVVTGNYDLYISFLGYNEKKITTETTLKNPDMNLGNILLSQSTVLLDAVEITEERYW